MRYRKKPLDLKQSYGLSSVTSEKLLFHAKPLLKIVVIQRIGKANFRFLGYSQIFRVFESLKTLLPGDGQILCGHECHWVCWWHDTSPAQLWLAGVHVSCVQCVCPCCWTVVMGGHGCSSISNDNPFIPERVET